MKKLNMPVIVHNLQSRSYVDGLLGLNYLKNFRLCIDFRKGILKLD
jgi:hypothetical protein